MTPAETSRLNEICRKLEALDSTADLNPRDKADFTRLTAVWDEEEHAKYVRSQMSQFVDDDY